MSLAPFLSLFVRRFSSCSIMSRRRTSSVSASFHTLVLGTNITLTSPGIYYIPNNSHLHFTLSSSLIPYDVQLFCDYHSTNFKRGVYHKLTWSSKSDDRFAQIICTRSGPVHYYFTTKHEQGEGYIIVEPSLSNSPTSDSDEIMCLTVLSKSLGKMEDWQSRLAIAYHTNYNMIHFTPIQQLYRISNSSYSITHHHQLNPLFGKDKTHNDIKQIVDKMADEWKILSITDLVYNHAANDCAILEKHPEASYNLINSPHLKPAFLLDAILMQFTYDVHQGRIEKIPAKIKKEHLPIIKDYLLNEVFPPYALHEFYMINVTETINEFARLIQNELPSTSIHNYEEEYIFRIDYGSYTRYGGRINFEKAREIFYCADRTPIEACQLLTDRLIYLNHLKKSQIESDIIYAIRNCLNGCEYHFFDPHGPHFATISPKTPFVGNYFAYPHDKIFETSPTEIEQAYNDNNKTFLERVMAHNGWVMNDNPLRNFAEDTQGPNVYFRRELNQWSDIVKLNFGSCEADSPHLWAYMKEYTRLIATTFHGARLDNCHSTPLHVAQVSLF
jgi:glycogen debranching enzyme